MIFMNLLSIVSYMAFFAMIPSLILAKPHILLLSDTGILTLEDYKC